GPGAAAAPPDFEVSVSKAMTALRSRSVLSPGNGILLPGTTFCGSVRYASSVAASHVRLLAFMAGEKLYPDTEAAFSPTILASDGPMPFLPASSEWHAWHFRNTWRPPATSPVVADLEAAPAAACPVLAGL